MPAKPASSSSRHGPLGRVDCRCYLPHKCQDLTRYHGSWYQAPTPRLNPEGLGQEQIINKDYVRGGASQELQRYSVSHDVLSKPTTDHEGGLKPERVNCSFLGYNIND